ncbi:MAG: hypothetical protein FWD83_10535, partial [Promicromonosporaceae bacterium]|nr:hypothetical protein [Promicromonosporaceae bacterium]
MTTPNTRRRRPIFALALALVASSTIVGCATMPTAGGVYIGGQGVIGQEGIGQIAAGPSDNADPGEIVRGFLLAAQAGPNTPLPFFVAREYLEGERRTDWQPYAQVLVLSGTPTIDAPEQVMPDQDQVTVIVGGEMVAIVDERGVFTELATPSEIQKRFELSRVNGQWRIVDLEDVLLIPTQVFNITFRATQLHFPTRDWQHWVIDQRWFAQQTWRTQAVQELLLGPPSWLIGAVDVLLPEGTSLAIPAALTVEPDGSIEVSLSEHIDDASVEARAMFAEQVRATLASGAASPRIVLVDRLGPMVQTDDIEVPSQARTIGAAQVLQHGRFMTLNGRHLENQLWVTGLHDYEPTALAVAPGVERGLMVMRVAGRDEVPEPEGEYPEENGYEENGPEDATPPEAEPEPTDYACAEEENGEECPPPKPVEPEANSRIVRVDDTISTLAQGVDLIAPSIDRFGLIWTGQAAGELFVVSEQGHKSQVIVPWLI